MKRTLVVIYNKILSNVIREIRLHIYTYNTYTFRSVIFSIVSGKTNLTFRLGERCTSGSLLVVLSTYLARKTCLYYFSVRSSLKIFTKDLLFFSFCCPKPRFVIVQYLSRIRQKYRCQKVIKI